MMKLLTSVQACQLTASEVSSYLEVDTSAGLNTEEVVRRRFNHGNNDFDISEDKPLWKKYLEQVCLLLMRRSQQKSSAFLVC